MKKPFKGLITAVLGTAASTTAAPAEDRPPLPRTYDALVEMGYNHVLALNSAHDASWRMGSAERFDVDLMKGEITFSLENGTVARAPAQLLGTWNPQDDTFLWGWDHPSAPPGTATAAAALRDYAEEAGIEALTTPKISCSFDDCYRIASAAILVADMQALYRFDAGGPWAYLALGTITLSAK